MTSLPFKFIEKKTPGSFLKSQVAQVDENTILVSDKRFVRSVCWYFKRNDAFLLYDCGELEWGVMAHEDSTHRLLRPISQFQKLINNLTPEQKIVLVATPDRFKGYIEAFGKPTEEHRSKYIVLGIYRYRGANRPVTEAQ